jgi:hypothetical protein
VPAGHAAQNAGAQDRQIWRGPPGVFLSLACSLVRLRLVTGWTWNNPRWQDSVGDDAEAAVREALRRAVDLRDTLAEAGSKDTARALFLVDALNHLAELQDVDTSALWDRP